MLGVGSRRSVSGCLLQSSARLRVWEASYCGVCWNSSQGSGALRSSKAPLAVAPSALTLSASGRSGIWSCSFLGPQRREEAGGTQEPGLCCPLLSSSAGGGVRPPETRQVGQIWVILCADQLGAFGDRPAPKGDAPRCLRPLPSGFRKCLCRQE